MPVTHEVTSSSLVHSANITTMETIFIILVFLILAGIYIGIVALAIHINKDLYKDLPEDSKDKLNQNLIVGPYFHGMDSFFI